MAEAEAEPRILDRTGMAEYLDSTYGRMSFLSLVREDSRRYMGALNAMLYVGFWVVLSYRISHLLHRRGLDPLGRLVQLAAQFVFKCEVNRKCTIGPGLAIFHCMDILIGPYVKIGKLATISCGNFLASRDMPFDPADYPLLGDGVVVGPGAKVVGPVVIGNESWIGPNAVVMKNVAPYSNVMPPNCLTVSRAKWKNFGAAPAAPAAPAAAAPIPNPGEEK
jgi:serine O-acetyltransferase